MIFLLQMYPPPHDARDRSGFYNHFFALAFNLFSFTLRESPTGTDKNPTSRIAYRIPLYPNPSFISPRRHFSLVLFFHPQSRKTLIYINLYTHHTDDNSNTFRWENRHTCQSTRNTNPQPHRRKRPTNIGQKYHNSNTRLSSPPTLSFNKSYESIKVLGYHYR